MTQCESILLVCHEVKGEAPLRFYKEFGTNGESVAVYLCNAKNQPEIEQVIISETNRMTHLDDESIEHWELTEALKNTAVMLNQDSSYLTVPNQGILQVLAKELKIPKLEKEGVIYISWPSVREE